VAGYLHPKNPRQVAAEHLPCHACEMLLLPLLQCCGRLAPAGSLGRAAAWPAWSWAQGHLHLHLQHSNDSASSTE
jgi:hypothetical protein